MGRSDSTFLRTMVESDRPNVLHPQAWALSNRPNRPPGASRAFLSDAPKSSMPLTRFCHLARSGTIWVKIVPSPRHGEQFEKVVLWPAPNGGSGLPWRSKQHPRIASAVVRGVRHLIDNYSIPVVQQRQQYSSLSHYTRRAVVGGLIDLNRP